MTDAEWNAFAQLVIAGTIMIVLVSAGITMFVLAVS